MLPYLLLPPSPSLSLSDWLAMPPEEVEHWCSLQKPGNQAGHNFCLVAGEDKVHRGHSVPLLLTPSHQGITNNRPLDIQAIIYAGWWYTYPSENMKVSWDDNIWKNKKCSKAPTSTKRLGRSHDDSLRTVAFQREQHLTFTAQQCPAPGKRIGRLPALQDSPAIGIVGIVGIATSEDQTPGRCGGGIKKF